MKLTNREKILLPSVLIVILSMLFLNFVFLPINEDLKTLTVQAVDMRVQLQDAKAKQIEIEDLNKKYATLKKEIEDNNKDILKIWDQTELLVFVEKTMATLSKQKSIDFYDVVSTDTLQAGDVDVTFETTYNNLNRIINQLEKADYFSTISNFSIKEIEMISADGSSTENKLEVSMTIRFYSIYLESSFPDKYSFMNGSFGKTNIFQ